MSILGTRVVRTEDPRLLTAGGTYTHDLPLPEPAGAAHGGEATARLDPEESQ